MLWNSPADAPRLTDRVLIYADATTPPTLKTSLITGVSGSQDFMVVE